MRYARRFDFGQLPIRCIVCLVGKLNSRVCVTIVWISKYATVKIGVNSTKYVGANSLIVHFGQALFL